MGVLVGCGAGTADDAKPLASEAPVTAPATAPSALGARTTEEVVAAAAPTTAPTPAALAAAPVSHRDGPAPMPKALPIDAVTPQGRVLACAEISGAEADARPDSALPQLPECPAGDALPPASSSWFVSAVQAVDPTVGRDAGVSLQPR